VIEYIRRDMSIGENPNFVPCPDDLRGTSECGGGLRGDEYLLSKCSPNASLPMTAMSAFWTFVPMVLTGLGEILVNPVLYQFVFEEAPSRLRSVLQALNLVAAGAISNAITAALGPLVPENLNTGQVSYYFYMNIGFAVVMLLAYWYVAAYSEANAESAGVNGEAIVEGTEQQLQPRPSRSYVVASFISSEQRGVSLLGRSELPEGASLLSLPSAHTHSTRIGFSRQASPEDRQTSLLGAVAPGGGAQA